MAKQTKKQTQNKRKQQVFGAVIVVLALLAGSSLAYLGVKGYNSYTIQERKDRIVAIYDSLKLSDSYQLTDENVFGDKRVYSYDKGRTYSSERDYVRGATVPETVAELDTAIKAAGFSFVAEAYPGSYYVQYHYKSEKGEYIRITVSSKPRDDAIRNDALMGRLGDSKAIEMDKNTAPSNVVIKVNLDDNNE